MNRERSYVRRSCVIAATYGAGLKVDKNSKEEKEKGEKEEDENMKRRKVI